MAEENNIINDKYKGLKKEIADEIEGYEFAYFREDKGIPFCGLTIYPAQVRDYEIFSNCTTVLTLNKNEDPKGIRMSHLDYLISKIKTPGPEGVAYSYKLQKLFEIIFHIKNGVKCSKCGKIISYDGEEFKNYLALLKEIQSKGDENAEVPKFKCPDCEGEEFTEMIKVVQNEETKKYELLVDGHKIDRKALDRLRQIVLFQNYPDYRDDSWVDPDLKRDYEEKMKLERQKNDVHATIEKKVICLSITTNYKFEEIWGMSIRRFTMALATVDDLINYKIMRSAVSSGFVSLPKGKTVEHWIYKPDKDMYGDAYKSVDEIEQQTNNL